MFRYLLVFVLFLALLPATPVSAAECQFVLGFATLRDMIGHDIVGECLEKEHYNSIGDSNQQTTGGLMAWRKADNWTAFTDGHRTWINGPNGLVTRLNHERFPWEAQPETTSGSQQPVIGHRNWDGVLNHIASSGTLGAEIAQWIRANGIRIGYAILPEGKVAFYNPQSNAIAVSHRLSDSPIYVIAYSVVHEYAHAYTTSQLGPRPGAGGGEDCIKDEVFAELMSVTWYFEKFPTSVPNFLPISVLERLITYVEGEDVFRQAIRTTYAPFCGVS